MRKIISLILAVLMVSMMIPAMALAEDSATPVDYAGLVAGETFTVEVTGLTSETATISVNTQLFSIDGAASAIVEVVEGVASVEVTVNAQVPAVVEASRIKIEADGVVSYQVAAIKDRLIGDVDGKDGVTVYDASLIATFKAGNSVAAAPGFKEIAGDVDGKEGTTVYDASLIATFKAGNGGVAALEESKYMGEGFVGEVVDPFENEGPETPDVPAEPTALATPANIYAYAQNGRIYYTFDAVEGAEGYSIKVSTVETVFDVTDATGSITCDYTADMTIVVTATTTAEGFTNSAESTPVPVIQADASGALAEWLEENGLEDVAITVHEIK